MFDYPKDIHGYVTYDLVYESGEIFSMEMKFDSLNDLHHRTSFMHLKNMIEKYQVHEVRIHEVYFSTAIKDLEKELLLERLLNNAVD